MNPLLYVLAGGKPNGDHTIPCLVFVFEDSSTLIVPQTEPMDAYIRKIVRAFKDFGIKKVSMYNGNGDGRGNTILPGLPWPHFMRIVNAFKRRGYDMAP